MNNHFSLVRESINFVYVARDHRLEFDRSGKALCPFHNEKTPSFSLHPSGLYAKCFGCGVSVDVIELEYKMGQHANRWEAAKALDHRYQLGLNFNGFDKEKAEEISNVHELLNWYCRQTHKALLKNKDALAWLEKTKGITVEEVKEHCIGYVGDGWIKNKVTEISGALSLKIGLLKETNGKIYDAFWDRLTFPIYKHGKIVSIWTREFPDKANSSYKWLGLPNSELIPNKPIPWVEDLNCECCVVTEGITDAMAFLKIDIPAVALLGKEISEANRVYFEKAKTKLYFALDSDEPGKEASHRLAKEYKGYILDLGYGKDPDEVLAELGPEEFKKLAENTIEEARYYLDVVIERESAIEALREIVRLGFATEQELWLKKLSDISGITLGALREDLKHVEQLTKSESQTQSKPEPKQIDLLVERKPSLHPAMDWIDGKLIYGTSNSHDPLFIYDRKVVDLLELSKKYSLASHPRHSRFSSYGIKTHLNGGEIRAPKLYMEIHNLLYTYVSFKEAWQPHVLTIWIFGTYLHRVFPLYPYIWIQSPTKRCGKTRLLELLGELCFNSEGIQTAPTEAVLYRLPAITAGTLCWDEAENLHNHKEKGERLEILNSAYRKGAKVPRCEGEDHQVNFYEVFRPIALAGISTLPDTVADRSLKTELIRKRRDEKVKRLQVDRLQPELQSLRDGLHIFALERASIIVEAYSQFQDDLIPKEVDDRLRDAFEILISIAAGIYRYDADEFKPILNHLQTAAKVLSGIRITDEDDTSFIRAISVLKAKLDNLEKNDLFLTSQEAVDVLKAGGLDWIAEPKDARKVLRKLGCKSKTHRQGGEVLRGYLIEKERLEDLFQRYGGTFTE